MTKWLPAPILDVRNSLSIVFLAISDRYTTLFCLEIFDKMAAVGHFGCPKLTFDRISGHFRSIRNFIYFLNFFTKWPPAVILNVRKSLLIAFLAISDRSAILDVSNSLSIAILAISDRYRILLFFSAAILDVRKSLSIAFLGHFWSIGHIGWPKFTFNGIFGHFRSIRILIIYLYFWQNGRLPFWMFKNNFRSHFLPFQIDTQLFFLTKWPPAAILDGTTMSIIELVRDIWMSNACVKFEECSLKPSKVIALTTKLWRGGGGCVADENIIFPKTYVSREYNYLNIDYTAGWFHVISPKTIKPVDLTRFLAPLFCLFGFKYYQNTTMGKVYI